MTDTAWKVGQILVWLIVGLAWYFGDSSVMKERVAVLEARIEQEGKGYSILQAGLGSRMEKLDTLLNDRLDKVDRKLDCLVNRSLCH